MCKSRFAHNQAKLRREDKPMPTGPARKNLISKYLESIDFQSTCMIKNPSISLGIKAKIANISI
jgi:hypothetical protein